MTVFLMLDVRSVDLPDHTEGKPVLMGLPQK